MQVCLPTRSAWHRHTLCNVTSLPLLTSLPVLPDASITSMLRPAAGRASTQHSTAQREAQESTPEEVGTCAACDKAFQLLCAGYICLQTCDRLTMQERVATLLSCD